MKKTTVVTTRVIHTEGGKTTETVKTVTVDGDVEGAESMTVEEIDKAFVESRRAMDEAFSSLRKVFEPFDHLFRKKK